MAYYISKLHLKNIRCFEDLRLEFSKNGEPITWTTLFGDNSTGKTTLLRCIAIGLCDESSGAGLLRESEQGYIRRNRDEGVICITLRDFRDSTKIITIETTIKRKNTKKNPIENLRQEITPEYPKIWNDIFLCGYGIGRGTSGTGDLGGYSIISAVYNLFNYSEGLQNPELVIRRKRGILKKSVKPLFKKLLHLRDDDDVHLSPEGITVDGPWGKRMPLRDLADGYKSTFQWVIDFIGWAILHQPYAASDLRAEGIVLVDSIEEHIHPKWQRTIVRDLRLAFPRIQFITTSHSPIIAGNTSLESILNSVSRIYHLYLTKEGVRSSEIEEDLTELNCDQILASEAFGHIPSVNKELPELLTKASALASLDDRTEDQEETLNKIKDILKLKMFPKGRTLIERIVERDYYQELESEIMSIKHLIERDSDDND